jgi:diaminohydroxyphosphoribosylaminopyrimidine deaminase/5-amino-6-(5-phosphoribosylamino)uracil reductase
MQFRWRRKYKTGAAEFRLMDRFMALALELAKKADPFPNPRVGAVLVRRNKIVGTGYHHRPGLPHAEIEAIRDAKRRAGNPHAARGATLYVTLEPCSHTAKRTPPCTGAIAREGIARVVYGMRDPNPLAGGLAELKRLGIAASCIRQPAARRRIEAVNRRYVSSVLKKPFVMIKMAMSADGRSATRTGDSRWISSEESRRRVHLLRSRFDAVMVGAGTVKADDPELTARLVRGRNPWRIIVDHDLCIPASARVLRNRDRKTIIAASENAPRRRLLNALVMRCGRNEVDLGMLVRALGAMGMKKILIEGGSGLNARALEAGIVDRLTLFVAPKLLGGSAAIPVIGGAGVARVADAMPLKLVKAARSGPDLLLVYDVVPPRGKKPGL